MDFLEGQDFDPTLSRRILRPFSAMRLGALTTRPSCRLFKIQQDAGTGVAALQRGAVSGFLSATALLNADRGILLVEDEVLALPEVQEQCA